MTATELGTPPNYDANYIASCPSCGAVLNSECEGYGFAYGGGMGFYQFCPTSSCDWFFKEISTDDRL